VRVRDPRLQAGAAGTLWIGGDLQVNRIGLGTAEFTGPNRWGEPEDVPAVLRLLRRAYELGVNYIDTADVYGPFVAEQLIREALHPYPADLVIATKGGQLHGAGSAPNPDDGSPQHLRQACEASLQRLGLEEIPLYQMHEPDPKVPYAESIGELARLQMEGKIRHIGVANVDVALLAKARAEAKIATVQNPFNLLSRQGDDMLAVCERTGMAFIPARPLGRGEVAGNLTDTRLRGLKAVAQLTSPAVVYE